MKPLNPLLHAQLRLSVISLLLTVTEADFVWLKEKTGATAGNLSVQIENWQRPNTSVYVKKSSAKSREPRAPLPTKAGKR